MKLSPLTSLASLAVAGALAALSACSSGSSGTASNADGGTSGSTPAASCSSACSNLGAVCKQPVPSSCAAQCQSQWTSAQTSCLAAASSCTGAQQCLTAGSTPDGGTLSDSGSSGGSSGGTVSCSPWNKFTDSHQSCAHGCSTAQADDQKSIWCLKYCTADSDCTGGVVPGSCQTGTESGNPKVCVPVCANNSQCTSEGWGSTCNMLHKPGYCNGGPAYVF